MQRAMWWDDDTIERTVTRQFVRSQLIPAEIERLDGPLGFGDNLTDGTYWEWIDERAKKIFLILTDLGLPDQIFGLIDDSLDDEDLPISLEQVGRLALTSSKDEKIEKKFYYRQFHYLLRPLQQGYHGDYDDDEVVPLDIVDKRAVASQGPNLDKVVLPNHPDKVLCRCRVPIGPGSLNQDEFLSEVDSIRDVQDEHMLSFWASYTHRGFGYVLFTPAPEFTLKSLLTTMPHCLKELDKKVRRQTVLNWIRCLVDTICSLHNRGLSHGNIKPSTVMFTSDNQVFFSEFSRFHTMLLGGPSDVGSFDKEAYDYMAPEQWYKPHSSSPTSGCPADAAHTLICHTSSQATDIFSLGCIILELLSFLLKKQGRPFAAHRAARHKIAGRGGAVPDSSFHKNLGQIESWMFQLAKDAAKQDDPVFKCFSPMLHVVERMLAFYPAERPTAVEIQVMVHQLLAESGSIPEPPCGHWRYSGSDWGVGSLRLSTLSTTPPSSAGSSDTISIPTKVKDEIQEEDRSRRGSGGSVFGSIRKVRSSVRESEKDRASAKSRNDVLAQNRPKPWQAPMYQGRGFVLMDR
ncbi:hypothetical protein VTI74DRAFT_2101 [Chaetomium olivicolor]